MTNSLLVLSAHPFFKSDSLLKSRKNIFNFLFLLIIIPTILSCSKQEHSRANQIVVALDSNPTQLDPRLSQDSVSNQINAFVAAKEVAVIDNYAEKLGLDDKNIFNAPVTIIDPQYADDDNRLITTIFNPYEASDYLKWKRNKQGIF